jgi:hypothetical protein
METWVLWIIGIVYLLALLYAAFAPKRFSRTWVRYFFLSVVSIVGVCFIMLVSKESIGGALVIAFLSLIVFGLVFPNRIKESTRF